MLHLSLLLTLAIQVAQPGTLQPVPAQPMAAKTSTPVQVPSREVWEHVPSRRPLSFLRIKPQPGKFMFGASIEVQTTVDPEGNVVAVKAPHEVRNLQLPSALFEQAEAMVRELHFKPFERDGKPVSATFTFGVALLPPELKPAAHVPFPRVKDWKALKITLQRTGCYGECPSYSVEVHGDGSVLYSGGSYVAFNGKHRGMVPMDNVLELVKFFEQADYFSLRDEYQASVTDCPTYITSIQFDGKRKQVVNYMGLQIGMPAAVEQLENMIDDLSGSERWIKGNSDTITALRDEHWDFKSKAAAETLVRVADRGSDDLVRDLVLAGVPLNGRNEEGHGSPLQLAAYHGDLRIARVLLAAGAASDPEALNASLMASAYAGKVEVFRLLIDAGADISTSDAAGDTLLMEAARSGSPEMVREVLKRKANVNAASTPDPPPCTAEMKKDNCPEFDEHAGRTALMEAVSQEDYDAPPEGVDRLEVVRLLLAAGADVNARDNAGNTALILCTNSAEQAKLLLQAGADPNARNLEGATALSSTYDNEVKAVLIKHGAVPKIEDGENK